MFKEFTKFSQQIRIHPLNFISKAIRRNYKLNSHNDLEFHPLDFNSKAIRRNYKLISHKFFYYVQGKHTFTYTCLIYLCDSKLINHYPCVNYEY